MVARDASRFPTSGDISKVSGLPGEHLLVTPKPIWWESSTTDAVVVHDDRGHRCEPAAMSPLLRSHDRGCW